MIRRPPRSTQSRSSAASDVYKRQAYNAVALGANAQATHEKSVALGSDSITADAVATSCLLYTSPSPRDS